MLAVVAAASGCSPSGGGGGSPTTTSAEVATTLPPVPADGTRYNVAPGGDDAADGSKEHPLHTIQRAVDLAGPGASIVLSPGEYLQDVRSRRAGTPTQPITITGPRDAVVKGGGAEHVVEIRHSHLMVTGFTIDGLHGDSSSPSGFRSKLLWLQGEQAGVGVTGVRIFGMHISNALGECVRMRYFAHGNEVAANTITNCGVEDFRFHGEGKNGEAIYIGTAPEQRANGVNATSAVDESSGNQVHDNIIDTGGNECVDIKEGASANVVFANSCTGQLDPESGGLDARGSGNVFRDNTVFGNAGAGIRLGGDGEQDGIGNDVYGNTFRDNAKGGVKFMRKPQGRVCGNRFFGNADTESVGEYADDFEPTRQCRDVPSKG